jgi:hypothetical protein
MKRSTELVLATGLTAALSAGCTAELEEPSVPAQSAAVRQLGKDMLRTILADPAREMSKPNYTAISTVAPQEGISTMYSVQTKTAAQNPDDITAFEVIQTGPKVDNFALSFMARDDGMWNVYCHTDPYESSGGSMAIIGEETVQFDGETIEQYGITEARALVSDEVAYLGNVLLERQDASAAATPLEDPCRPSLGAG